MSEGNTVTIWGYQVAARSVVPDQLDTSVPSVEPEVRD